MLEVNTVQLVATGAAAFGVGIAGALGWQRRRNGHSAHVTQEACARTREAFRDDLRDIRESLRRIEGCLMHGARR